MRNHKIVPQHDIDYWLDACNRYFDASLSPDEELQLKQFVASTSDPRFSEVKAVMGFASLGRKLHAKPRSQRRIAPWLAAACIALLVASAAVAHYRQSNCLISYVGGVKSTDVNQALQLMHDAMHDVDINQSGYAVDEQLHDIFNTINQPSAL